MAIKLLDVKTWLNKVFSLFFIAGFIFIPLTFYGLYYQYLLTKFLFLKPVSYIQNHFFGYAIKNIDFSSDTIALNILLCLLLALAFILILLLDFLKVRTFKIIPFFRSLSAYYIASILLKYGFDKIFKRQFSLPEPNILYTDFGGLTRDVLFWNAMGTSYSYSLVTGVVEILTAVLILIKRTRTLGFCLSIGILGNILLINFSFDISVKTFTAFLLCVVVFNVYPHIKNIYGFFVQHKQIKLVTTQQPGFRYNKWIRLFGGIGLVCYALFPYISSGNFNDDNTERPLLHGAYNVERFIIGNDTLNNSDFPYKRFFIHRNSYIIFQQRDDTMVDYYFEINPIKKQLELQDYKNNKITITYNYVEKTGNLQLRIGNNERWVIESKSLNWKALPALQDRMHYTIDEIK